MRINKYLGRAIEFENGLKVGWSWIHSNGESSKTSANLIGYHNPKKNMWKWVLRIQPKVLVLPKITKSKLCKYIWWSIPFIGHFTFSWQNDIC